MKKWLPLSCRLSFVCLLLLSGGAPATWSAAAAEQMESEAANEQQDAALMELLAILDEETEIATKTKLNSDYVPGIVTVLHGDHLDALGMQSVADALALVPGIQMARIGSGEPSVKVRGFAYPFNSGNIKVMLNSIPLSRQSSGINSSVLLMPIEQVDRIEIIRGPGSSIYGDFAMTGVINIYTRKRDGRIFGKAGDDESHSGGGHYGYDNEEQSLGAGINISYTDGGENGATRSGSVDEDRTMGVAHFDYRDFSFLLEGVFREVTPMTSNSPPNGLLAEENSWAMEGRQEVVFNSHLDCEVFLSYLRTESGNMRTPRAFAGDRYEAGMDVNWSPVDQHQLLLQFGYGYGDIDNAIDRGRPGLAVPFEVSTVSRHNYSLGLQDQISLIDPLTLSLGLRYDYYDDVGDILTPRFAAVFRPAEHHVVKAQYSRGFRAPTFWELYRTGTANDDLDFEVIDTVEIGYIYRRPKLVGRLTVYHSKIRNGLFTRGDQEFSNDIDIESSGVEVEWEQAIGDRFRWLANISYNDTSDERWAEGRSSDSNAAGIADWIGNLAFFYEIIPRLMATGRLLHMGDRHAPGNGWIDGYDSVDFTLSYSGLLLDGLKLQAGVKNVFDDDVVYTTQRPHGLSEDRFEERTWWLELSYSF